MDGYYDNDGKRTGNCKCRDAEFCNTLNIYVNNIFHRTGIFSFIASSHILTHCVIFISVTIISLFCILALHCSVFHWLSWQDTNFSVESFAGLQYYSSNDEKCRQFTVCHVSPHSPASIIKAPVSIMSANPTNAISETRDKILSDGSFRVTRFDPTVHVYRPAHPGFYIYRIYAIYRAF